MEISIKRQSKGPSRKLLEKNINQFHRLDVQGPQRSQKDCYRKILRLVSLVKVNCQLFSQKILSQMFEDEVSNIPLYNTFLTTIT